MRGGLFPLFRLKSVLRPVFAVCAVICVLLMLEPNTQSWAAKSADSPAVPLVGIGSAPPFAMKDSQGNWEGVAVDLWRHVAQDLGLQFEFREMALDDLPSAVERGELIAAVIAAASADGEKVMDFSHPYYPSGLAIAVPVNASGGAWFAPLENLISVATARITIILLGLLLIAAILVWFLERRANPRQFNPRPLSGIADGLWWSAVTLTTVGYGDKAPKTRVGRAVGAIWMFSAVILIALFTAQVTSSLTVTSLRGRVRGPADLPHVRVGTLQASQSQAELRAALGVFAAGYGSFGEGLQALDRGKIDAFVGPEPVLRYEIANRFPGRLAIVGTPFLRVDYVFAFPLGAEIRKRVNQSLLLYIDTDEWRRLKHKYLGSDG
jgi:polar amino acid transport system substrate-binding protein